MTTTQRWTMLAVVLGSAIVFLDGTIVNVALATIGRELPGAVLGTLEGLTYVTSGYFATLAALLVLSGALADYYGRRRVFVIGLAGFGATSALCGLAPSLELLVVARIFQGAAGALLVPGAIAIITRGVRGTGSGPRVRHLGGGDGGGGPARAAHRRDARRHHRLARGLPDQRAAGAPRAVRGDPAHARDEERAGDRRLRLARLARGDPRHRRPRVRRDPRSAAALGRPSGVDRAGHRDRRPHRLPDPDGAAAEPARPAGVVSEPRVRRHQPVHAADLFRALRELRVPVARAPVGAGVHGAGRRGGRPAERRSCWRCCRPGSGHWPGGWGRVRSSSPDRCSWRRACCGTRGCRPRRRRGRATIDEPLDARPARGHLHRRAAGDRAVRRRASRWSSRRSRRR